MKVAEEGLRRFYNEEGRKKYNRLKLEACL
jgi:hypothetical protein